MKELNYFMEEASEIKRRFDSLKKEYKSFFKEIIHFKNIESFDELPGKRTPKIVRKLFNFPGDISPAMLLTLAKEIKEHLKFYEN